MSYKLDKEKGSVVVEASLVLPIFVIAAFLFINLINIFILHNKIQFAINAAAHEVSTYSYLYEKSGIRAAEKRVKKDGEKYTKPIDKTAESFKLLFTGIEKTIKEAKKTYKKAIETVDSIKGMKDKLDIVFGEVDNLKKNCTDLLNDVNDEIPAETQNKLDDIMEKLDLANAKFNKAIDEYNSSKKNGKVSQESESNILKTVEHYYNTVLELKKDWENVSSSIKNIKKAAEGTVNQGKTIVENATDTAKQAKKTLETGAKTVTAGYTAAKGIVDGIKNIKETLIGGGFIIADGLKYLLKNEAAHYIYKNITKGYLEENFLKKYGIDDGFDGLDFRQSTYLADKEMKMIDIMVSYEVNLTPFRMVLSDRKLLNLKVTQRVCIPAWLDGDGQKVDEKFKASKGESGSSSSGTSQPEANLPAIPNNTP